MTTLALPDTPAATAGETERGPHPTRAEAPLPRPADEGPRAAAWTASQLGHGTRDPRADLQRGLYGLGLTTAMGVALGLMFEGQLLWSSVIAVAWIPLSVLLFALPGLYILLCLFDAPVGASDMLTWTTQATFSVGLAYAGLAPLVGLYALTAPGLATAAVAGLALCVGGLHGLFRLLWSINLALSPLSLMARARCRLSLAGFVLFAAALALRAMLALPTFGALS